MNDFISTYKELVKSQRPLTISMCDFYTRIKPKKSVHNENVTGDRREIRADDEADDQRSAWRRRGGGEAVRAGDVGREGRDDVDNVDNRKEGMWQDQNV